MASNSVILGPISTLPINRLPGVPEDNSSIQPVIWLANKLKSIYPGLLLLEGRCKTITARAKATTILSNEHLRALSNLNSTILQEYCDFFLTAHHPAASPSLQLLSKKHRMLARIWHHGIFDFLELLRERLPDSREHMLAIVYMAYSTVGLLMEAVPCFLDTWIEFLGDIARYRMGIAEGASDYEAWYGVARTWYTKATDHSPHVGRLQHHLAVARTPNIVQRLFYFSKALVSVVPFPAARETAMTLFTPLLDKGNYDGYPILEAAFVSAFGVLFTRGSVKDYRIQIQAFLDKLDNQITRRGGIWKAQGPEIAATLVAGILDFGHTPNRIWKMYQEHISTVKARRTLPVPANQDHLDAEDSQNRFLLHREFWTDVDCKTACMLRAPQVTYSTVDFTLSETITLDVLEALRTTMRKNAKEVGHQNVVPFMVIILSFLWSLSYVGGALIYVEAHISWSSIVVFLNALKRSNISDDRVEAEAFPHSGTSRPLPEDFLARGAIWVQHVLPFDFFRDNVSDEDERTHETSTHIAARCERCLWLGFRLSSLNRYIHYDVLTKQFSVSAYALKLEKETLAYEVYRCVRASVQTADTNAIS